MAEGTKRKGEATREALMDAGFAVFAEKGFLRAQIGDIVGRAGKSNGVFHIYFKNKEALLDAWIDRCDEMVPWYQAETSLLFEKARLFTLRGYWSLYEKFGPVLEAFAAAALVNERFERRLSDTRRKADAGIARMIRHAQQEGQCEGIDAELAALSIGAVIARFTAHWFANRARLEARGIDRDIAIAQLDALYSGMLRSPPISASVDSGAINSMRQ